MGFEIAAYALFAVSAVLWIVSAATCLTPVEPGMEGLDDVYELATDLRYAAGWSAAAAVCMALGLIAQGVARYLEPLARLIARYLSG